MIKLPQFNIHYLLTLFPKLLKFSVLITLFLSLIFTLRLCNLHSDFNKKNTPNNTAKVDKPKTESQVLFETLIKTKHLLKVDANGHLIPVAKDFALARKVAGQPLGEAEDILLERLYYSIAGKAVRNQIKFWNHSRLFAAIRDDIPNSNKKTENRWSVRNNWDENPPRSDWVPLSYGYINGSELPTGFNDWLSISDDKALKFQASLRLEKTKTISLQVIGQPDLSQLKGKVTLYACSPITKEQRKSGNETTCQKTNKPSDDISAYVIKIKLSAGSYQLKLTVNPAINHEKRIDGLPIYIDENNKYAWEPVNEYNRNPIISEDLNYSFNLITNDGKALINPLDKRPSKFTSNNGLVPLVGYERSDRYALNGLLSNANLPHDNTEVRLTLDSKLQHITQKHLQKQIPTLGSNKAYAVKRRAAVVLMNPQTGAILAAANYPNPPKGIHHWDRISYSRLYPNRDPFGVNAWQGLDNHNAPGSTFKPVTALAAMQAVDEGRDDLESMIKGLSARQFKQQTGLSINSSSYQPDPITTSKVSNAGNAPLAIAIPYRTKNNKIYYPKLRVSGGDGCPSKPVVSKTLGMREATRDSLNVWYARLGVMMDSEQLETGGKDTSLAAMARLLGFGSIDSLADNDLPLNRILGGKGRGDVLNAFTGSLSLDNDRLIKRELALLSENKIEHSTALQRLTQNSFGQGIATTPLQMARVAATIATGKIPVPYLISAWDKDEIDPAEPRTLKLSLIDYLRDGMKAVPEVGTARVAFNRYFKKGRCRTYGKTGTAQLKGRGKSKKVAKFNSAWFIGWHEDKKGTPDVSFACMVTHAYAKGKRSGGSVCAPIIARILNEMSQQEAAK